MSDVQQGPGWWLASDGRWYPPELAPSTPDGSSGGPSWPSHHPGAPTSVAPGLATALRVGFYVVAGLSAVRVLLSALGWMAYSGYQDPSDASGYDAWRSVVRIEDGWGFISGMGSVTLLVLVIVWSWQAHRAVTDLGAEPSWRIGWTIGSWFTCCAAIIVPKLVLTSIERGALAPRRDGRVRARWDLRPTEPVGWLWWIALVLSLLRVDVTTTDDGAPALADSASLTTSYAVSVATALLATVAALAGAAYFRRMSDRLTPEGIAAHRDD